MTHKHSLKFDITVATIAGTLITILSYAVAVFAGWITEFDLLEAFAVFTSYVCTILVVFQRRINYVIGAISTAAYAILFIQMDLVASAILNIYLTPALIYGWFRWHSDEKTRPAGFVQLKWWPVYFAVTGVFYFGALGVVQFFGGRFAPSDAIILVGSILAQFLLDNKKIESWAVWAIVNVAAIYTYFNAELYLAGFQYLFFLGNTIFGGIMWYRSMKEQKVVV